MFFRLGRLPNIPVMDFTDHVWTECMSPVLGRWMHLDPCEGIYNNPLLYEKGLRLETHYYGAHPVYYSLEHKKRMSAEFNISSDLCPTEQDRNEALERELHSKDDASISLLQDRISKAECPVPKEMVTASVDGSVLDRIAKIMSCLRLGSSGKGVQPCAFYLQNGYCKFGRTCKFDHPMGTVRYSPSASSLTDMSVAPYMVGPSLATMAPLFSYSELRPEFISGSNPHSSRMPSSGNTSSSSVGLIFSQTGYASLSMSTCQVESCPLSINDKHKTRW
ncbi:Zinc finger CCCH domain-containing protein 6 [Camellia lanceoleosa]|nr:Zinc finger CCCH domain-containing protein 6 [Camellia lanceoleosa]